jgi:Fe-Mn family superoxide dismutase
MKHVISHPPYELNALEPHLSKETLDYHFGKHHQAYIANLNRLIEGTAYQNLDLVSIIRNCSEPAVFNNAAQVWNHTFFWNSMKPGGGGRPGGPLADAISARWGGHAAFTARFVESAVGNFGSGWTWLVKKEDGSLDVVNTTGAGTPLTTGDTPLLTIDVWEHAYYIDYRNERAKFVQTFLDSLVNWDFAQTNFA